MTFFETANYESFTLLIKVETVRPENIRIIVQAAEKNLPHTVFTDRFRTVTGVCPFYVRMPKTSKQLQVNVFNEKTGNVPKDSDKTFKIIEVRKLPLETKTNVVDLKSPTLSTFINFCTRFCFNAGHLDAGTYQSNNGEFLIEYLPTIKSVKTHQELTTPARINMHTGHIQISQRKFIPMTFPGRMAILLHEFSHFYANDDMTNEVEADLNALLIYLSLGYPRIEAYEVFLKTFIGAPTQMNKDRYDIINNFITKFEKTHRVYE